MVDQRQYSADLLDACELWFRTLDLMDKHLPSQDSDLIAPLITVPSLIDGVLAELARLPLTEEQRSTADALAKRLRDRHEAIVLTAPDGVSKIGHA
jgi:hypothetical protein